MSSLSWPSHSNYSHLNVSTVPSSGGTCPILLFWRSRVATIGNFFKPATSISPIWLSLAKMFSSLLQVKMTAGSCVNRLKDMVISRMFSMVLNSEGMVLRALFLQMWKWMKRFIRIGRISSTVFIPINAQPGRLNTHFGGGTYSNIFARIYTKNP